MKKAVSKIKNLDQPHEGLSILRALSLGLANFWRNKLLSFATITVIAIIIFIFNVILAIQFITNQALEALSERVDVVIYLQDDVNFSDITDLINDLQKVQGVSKVKYTSKEEALEIVSKTHPKTAELLKKFELKNPLPPSISVVTQQPEDQAYVQAFLEDSSYKNLIQNYSTEATSNQGEILSSVAKNLNSLSQFVHQIVFWMIFVIVLGGTLIMVNAIQLTIYMRRHEIYIMKLVGATPSFLRIPFIFEACLYGFFAVSLSFIILFFLSSRIQLEGASLLNIGSTLPFQNIFMIESLIAIILAIISSSTAIQRYVQERVS